MCLGEGVCVCAVCVCVCQISRENKTKERNVCVCDESYLLNRVFTKRLCVRDRERCAGLEVGRGQVSVSKCVH